jgi:hypothetical protein
MAKRTKKPRAKADVESYEHKEAKRKNIPTAENQKLVADEDKAIKKLRWKRNPDLDHVPEDGDHRRFLLGPEPLDAERPARRRR